MKLIQNSLLIVFFSLVLFSCEKEKEPEPEACQTCEVISSTGSSRVDVCPETLTYYEDGVYTITLQNGGVAEDFVADTVDGLRRGGYTCK